MPPAAVAPLIILVVAYLVWILRDIARSEVRYLPKWGWVLLTVVSIPLGGIVYLLMGREPQ
jgi:hypothetical protein